MGLLRIVDDAQIGLEPGMSNERKARDVRDAPLPQTPTPQPHHY